MYVRTPQLHDRYLLVDRPDWSRILLLFQLSFFELALLHVDVTVNESLLILGAVAVLARLFGSLPRLARIAASILQAEVPMGTQHANRR